MGAGLALIIVLRIQRRRKLNVSPEPDKDHYWKESGLRHRESPDKKPDPFSLSDADVERLLKEAVGMESLEMYDSGQAEVLVRVKDGKRDSVAMFWHENGQKALEGTFKDGEEVSVKYWNSKGEEVETEEEAFE